MKQAEQMGLTEPLKGSVRVNLSSVNYGGKTNHNIDYSKGDFKLTIPILEIIYSVNRSEDSVVERLASGDLIAISIEKTPENPHPIYYKEDYFTEIRNREDGTQSKFFYLKLDANSITNLEYLTSLSTKGEVNINKSTQEVVYSILEIPNTSRLPQVSFDHIPTQVYLQESELSLV